MNLAEYKEALGRFHAAVEREPEMRFSLKYEGELKSSNSSKTHVVDKNRLRWHFSGQLQQLFARGNFSKFPKVEGVVAGADTGGRIVFSWDVHSFNGIEFVAVLDRSFQVACSLKIQMDRPERPGSLFQRNGENTGDLDNRVKTLFDSLRMPHNENEVTRDSKNPSRNFCMCLFEDDSMVTELGILTRPSLEDIPRGHVKLNIDVEVRAHDLAYDPEA